MQQNRFDEVAKTWDQDEKRRVMASVIAENMKTRLAFSKQDVVMDLGAGTGLITFDVARLVSKVYAVDTSQGMLKTLTQKGTVFQAGEVIPHDWDVFSEEPFPEPVDVIVSAMAFHHISDVPQAIQNLYQVLSPQGKIAIADLVTETGDFHQDNTGVHHYGFSKEQLEEWFLAAGFREVKIGDVHSIEHTQSDGPIKKFPIFLATALK